MRSALPSLPTDVFLVPWPGDEDRRRELERRGLPRLLLVDAGAEPPAAADCLEDWVTVPAAPAELRARVGAVARHAQAHQASRPRLGVDGVVRFGTEVAALGPVEASVASALVAQFGAMVTNEQLVRAGWPAGPPAPDGLRRSIMRLRAHLAPLGLEVRTVRGRGYLLAVDPLGPADPTHPGPPPDPSWPG